MKLNIPHLSITRYYILTSPSSYIPFSVIIHIPPELLRYAAAWNRSSIVLPAYPFTTPTVLSLRTGTTRSFWLSMTISMSL